MNIIILILLLSLSTLHTASGCYQSENIECSCTNTTISCSGFQREYDEMKDILLNITSYSTTDFLYLDWNIKNLTLESNFTFGDLKLKYLTLSSDLKDFPDNLFSGLELTLISLNLQYNNFDRMENQPLSSLGVLKELLLDFNNFHSINADLFVNLSKLEVLSLSKNKLNSLDIDFLNLPEIQTLNLDNNNFSAISDIKIKSGALNNLHLQNCSVKGTLENDSLQYVPNLENLDLSFNQLLGMNSFALSNLKHLKVLNVSHNSMEYLKDYALSALQDLTSLDLKNNKLLLVAEKAFLNLVNLKYFDLSINRLEVFIDKYTVDLHLLESMNLEDNKIKQITTGTFSISNNLKEIFLKGNIFDCTCELSYFVGYLMNNSYINLNDTDDAICNSPPEMKGKSLIEMDIENMNCENLDTDIDVPSNEDDYDDDYYADTTSSTPLDETTYISTTENLNTATDGLTTKNLNITTDGSVLTAENLNTTTDGSVLTTENLNTTTDGSVLTTENLNTTTEGSVLTTENLNTTTDGSVLTTENLNTTTDGSVLTTENLNTTTEGSVLTTENLNTTTEGSVLTTENLNTTTDGSVLTTENLNTSTDDSVSTTENVITLINDLFETTKENTPTYTSDNSVSTTENQITYTTSQSSTAESAFTYTVIKSESTTESLTTTTDARTDLSNDSSIMNTTILPSRKNTTDFISDLNSVLNTTTSSNTYYYITTIPTTESTISTTELQTITTQSPEPEIQILDSFISEDEVCVRWRIDKNLVGVNKCGLQTEGLNGKKGKSFACSKSEKGTQKCISVSNVYTICLYIHFTGKPAYQFCPEIPKLSTSPKSSTETTTISSAISTTNMLTTHLPSEIPTTSPVTETPTTLPSLDSTTISSSSKSTISSSSLTPTAESSTVFPTSATPIHSSTEFQITQTTEAKVTKVHFKLISFDLTVDHDKSIALAKWTVSKKEPLSMCNLMLTIASKGFNKTLGTFNCASSHHKIFSVEDFAFFKVCLRVFHKLYATQELCKSFSGLPYQLKAVKTKDAGYTNSSFIALTCLLLVVLLIIIVLVLKKVLKKRGESERYNVCDQEKKIQRRISHKRPESCVRYSYTVKDQEEIQL